MLSSDSSTTEAIDDQDLRLAAYEARESIAAGIRIAREDPAYFAAYVCRAPGGKTITLADMHQAWHDFLSKYDRFVIWSHVEAGKTTQVSVLRVLWEIGRNPNLRVLILSATQELAKKIATEIAGYILESADLHEVFPNLLPTQRRSEVFQPLSGKITVRRTSNMKDATITIGSLGSRGILGSRYDLVILDDILNDDNTATKEQRKGTIDWIDSNVQTRLTAHGRMYVVGTAFHPEDALHHYGTTFTRATGQTRAMRYPVIDQMGKPRWPEVWPAARIEQKRADLVPGTFARAFLCEARADADSVFKREWIQVAVTKGAEIALTSRLDRTPFGYTTITGVDLAVQKHDAADLTVLFTILVAPNGAIQVLECLAARMEGPEILDAIDDVSRRWGSVVFVENNGAQDYIVQFMKKRGSGPRVNGLTTGVQKLHPEYGVQRIATELFQGKWVIPSKGGLHPSMQAFIDEMIYYDPRVHTGDRLMAAYLARQGVDFGSRKAETGYINLQKR